MRSLLIAIVLGLFSLPAGAQTMVHTGECQRFDGVVVFPLATSTPETDCRAIDGRWVPHVVPADAVPEVIRQAKRPVFLPYGTQSVKP